MSKERPIMFTGRLVRAILEGRKTQTRRTWKPRYHPDARLLRRSTVETMPVAEAARYLALVSVCPYGVPGDRLWVREAWGPCEGGIIYRASEADVAKPDGGRWFPSIHMHRSFSRIDLELTATRVERLQGISEADAKAEGVESDSWGGDRGYRDCFELGWNTINGKRAPWASNPWVWVLEFRKVRP